MKTPHRCPVCNGRGLVPNGFYLQTGWNGTAISTTPESCRPCNGTGVLWSSDDEVKVEYKSKMGNEND